MKHRRGLLAALLVAFILLSLAACTLAEDELQFTARSPDGTWEARTYYVNPGAMASAWGRVDIERVGEKDARELWTGPPLPSAPVWLDDNTILVGEQRLAASSDTFDWYADAPVGGFATPKEAVERYILGLAEGDLEAVQQASRLIVTREELGQRQRETFRTTRHLDVRKLVVELTDRVKASDQAEFDVLVRVSWPSGDTKRLKLAALSCKERGAWHAEWAW